MKILHLYYDLMNLYGEYANVAVLERYLKQQGIDVETDNKSLYDDIDFSKYGFIYIGSGTEKKQLVALENIMQRKDAIKAAYESGAIILATGNAFELFGRKIISADEKVYEALGFFDFYTKVSAAERTLTDRVCTCPSGKKHVGFVNSASEVIGIKTPMFTIDFGFDAVGKEKTDGIIENNFFGTHLTGPCLVKNPHMAEYFVKLICEREEKEFVGIECEYEKKAYEITLSELLNRFGR